MKYARQLRICVTGLFCWGAVYAASLPVKVSTTNPRILVDQNNAPFLVAGDSPHALLVNLTMADAAAYLGGRAARGINSLWVNLLCIRPVEGRPDGYGKFLSVGPSATKPGGRFASNDYVTAALTPDGSLGMAYLPQGGTIIVAMTRLQNGVTARWFDPSANTFKTIAGSPFSNTGTHQFTTPGQNSAGEPDWVLGWKGLLGGDIETSSLGSKNRRKASSPEHATGLSVKLI